MNAGNNHPYDFKVTNGTSSPIPGIDIYRGMPIGVSSNGQTVYTSARDIGNIAAGYVAAVNGLSWEAARLGFDGYQSYTSKKMTVEGISTINAEYYGWRMGHYSTTPFHRILNFSKSIQSSINKFLTKAKTGSNYRRLKIGF